MNRHPGKMEGALSIEEADGFMEEWSCIVDSMFSSVEGRHLIAK